MKTLREVKDKLGQLLGIGCEGRCDNCWFNRSECLQPLIGDTHEHICTLERVRAEQASTITCLRDAINKQQKVQSRLLEEISLMNSLIPRWIPVEERLPEAKFAVLGYGLRYAAHDKPDKFPAEHVVYTRGEDEGWFTYWDHHYVKVTHWMPMPKPPKELEEKYEG